jgi:L-asparaginase / beta-aspartyl-peptidase
MAGTSAAVLAIHGGAGTILREQITPALEREYLEALTAILKEGQRRLAAGAAALDVVTAAVVAFEDCPLFNAGRGAVYTEAGTHEMDAAVMDGRNRRAGAVACVHAIKNPVLGARLVMERSGHVLLVGEGAEAFARQNGLELADKAYFDTPERYAQLQKARAAGASALDHDAAAWQWRPGAPIDPDTKHGTVGAVARDAAGELAAATSTGGMTNKRIGRVGDSPVIGAGCYADSRTVAVSSTGTGESFMRLVAAHDIAALMEYRGLSLPEAAEEVVMRKLPALGGRGGVVAVDRQGNVAMPFNTEGMYRGHARVGEAPFAAIYRSS